jgi:23S rRNA (cytosine1962-C5)-methyltransferase
MASDTQDIPRVRLKTAATGLRPWIYRKMVAAAAGVDNGSLVAIEGRQGPARDQPVREGEIDAGRGGVIGYGFYNRNSQIGLRVLRWGGGALPDDFLQKRIRDAVYLRTHFLQLDRVTNAYRVVNSEGDELSGLVVDRYGDVVNIQIHALAWYRRAAMVGDVLKKELGVRHAVVQVDEKVERAEGFRANAEKSAAPASVEIQEHGIRFLVDFGKGHKTGAFLDQRDNRETISRYVENRDVLDICCYQGGFAIPCEVRGGAGRIVAVDLDEDAIALARQNAQLNRCKKIEFVHSDAFDYLRAVNAGKRRFDVVILDPPKLAPSASEMHRAASKYTDLNELGMRAVKNHGLIYTCSCSGLVDEDLFLSYLRQAAARAKRRLRILAIHGAAPDHPVSPQFPQGKYLKCVLASVEEG